MKEKKRTCPRCGHRQVVSLPKCTECGLKYSRMENATHAEAMKAFKEKDKARVVYVNDIPSDLNKVKFIISLFFGFVGAPSLYVGKKVRGWYSLLSFVALFISMYVQTELYEAGIDTYYFNYFITTTFGLLCAASFVLWADDVVRAITRRYRFPVALPKGKPHEVLNIREELYEEIMKEKEMLNATEGDNDSEDSGADGKNNGSEDCAEPNTEQKNDNLKVEKKQQNNSQKKKSKKSGKKHKKSKKK